MESLFGARLVDANPKDEVTLRVVTPFGNLKVGDTFHYSLPTATQRSWGAILELKGGTVIAVDQDNRPALVSNTLGSGKTLLSAYPLESYLANAPAAFDKPENTHRIYEAFREWAGVRPLFHSDQPSVEVSSLNGGGRGYAVVTNHGPEPQSVRITASVPLHVVTKITVDGTTKVQVAGTKSFGIVVTGTRLDPCPNKIQANGIEAEFVHAREIRLDRLRVPLRGPLHGRLRRHPVGAHGNEAVTVMRKIVAVQAHCGKM